MVKWYLISFVSRSELRKKILVLIKEPITPTQIADKVNVSVTHISRTLRQFKERGLVKCLTPDERVWKLYKVTKLGEEVLKKVKEFEK